MKRIGELLESNPRFREAAAQVGYTDFDGFSAPLEITPACPVCEDLGMVRVAGQNPGDPFFGRLVPCPNQDCERGNEQRVRVWNNRYKNARIPEHYRGLTFDSWNVLDPAYKAEKYTASMAAYMFATRPEHYFTRAELFGELGEQDPDSDMPDRRKNCVMLFGTVGMGKTGLMAAAANLLLSAGRPLVYIREVDLIEEIQKRYGADEYPKADDVLRDFKTAPLLFLDELGDESAYPDRLQKIETVIEFRRAEYLPTFMTTNLNQAQFRAAWGDRTADRVINMAHWIEVKGKKLRETERPLGVV